MDIWGAKNDSASKKKKNDKAKAITAKVDERKVATPIATKMVGGEAKGTPLKPSTLPIKLSSNATKGTGNTTPIAIGSLTVVPAIPRVIEFPKVNFEPVIETLPKVVLPLAKKVLPVAVFAYVTDKLTITTGSNDVLTPAQKKQIMIQQANKTSDFPTGQVSGKDVVKYLTKEGFKVVSQNGSHVKLKGANGETVTVPVHGNKDIPLGTLKNIKKQAGLK